MFGCTQLVPACVERTADCGNDSFKRVIATETLVDFAMSNAAHAAGRTSTTDSTSDAAANSTDDTPADSTADTTADATDDAPIHGTGG